MASSNRRKDVGHTSDIHQKAQIGETLLLNAVINQMRLSFEKHVGNLVKTRKVLLNAVYVSPFLSFSQE